MVDKAFLRLTGKSRQNIVRRQFALLLGHGNQHGKRASFFIFHVGHIADHVNSWFADHLRGRFHRYASTPLQFHLEEGCQRRRIAVTIAVSGFANPMIRDSPV